MHELTMLEKLIFLTKKAEAEISGFYVSSIVIDEKGNEHQGVNVEYEVPTNSLCAERNAITTAITNGMRIGELKEVHVFARNSHKVDPSFMVSPCGACRQAILEASKGEAKVIMYNENGETREMSIKELVPFSFDGVEH